MSLHDVPKMTETDFINGIINYYKACQIPEDAINKIMATYSKSMLKLQAATPEMIARVYFNYYLDDIKDPDYEAFVHEREQKNN